MAYSLKNLQRLTLYRSQNVIITVHETLNLPPVNTRHSRQGSQELVATLIPLELDTQPESIIYLYLFHVHTTAIIQNARAISRTK